MFSSLCLHVGKFFKFMKIFVETSSIPLTFSVSHLSLDIPTALNVFFSTTGNPITNWTLSLTIFEGSSETVNLDPLQNWY